MDRIKSWGVATLAALPAVSFAAVPAGVTTAVADLQTDATTVAVIFLVAVIALAAIAFMRKGAH